jgi:uncharacterized delta-60 repeat protein
MKKIFTLILASMIFFAQAQDGTLDLTFGTNGKAYNQSVDGASRTVTFVQADGKILQNSNSYNNGQTFAAVRYNANGSIDNTFGTNGMVSTEVSTFQDNSNTITAQPDGKVIVGGQSYFIAENGMDLTGSLVLIRYNIDGTLDNSFDADGKMLYDVPGYLASAYNIKVLANGKIVVAGFLSDQNQIVRYGLLARFNANGSIDNTFGTNGLIIHNVGTANNDIYNLALQADGKIVVAGTATVSGHAQYVALRFSSEGVPDNSFGTNGQSIINITNYQSSVKSVAVQPDNKVIIAGNSKYIAGDPDKFTIVRLKEDGSLDETFASTGILSFNSSNRDGSFYSILIQQDNKIVLGGILTSYNIITQRTTSDFLIYRYTSAGVLDPTLTNDFALGQSGTTGASGQIYLNGGTEDLWGNIAFQGTKLIIGGTSSYQPQGNPFEIPRLIVARINNSIGSVLPLKLVDFAATAIGQSARLNWHTEQETGTKTFEIQRSADGIHFQKIGAVAATGGPHGQTPYSFTDLTPSKGINYYRLKILDTDGKFTWSDVRTVSFSSTFTASFSCYPVPSKGMINLVFGSNEKGGLLSVRNMAGAEVKRFTIAAGISTERLDLSILPKGVYNISMVQAGKSATQQVILQ